MEKISADIETQMKITSDEATNVERLRCSKKLLEKANKSIEEKQATISFLRQQIATFERQISSIEMSVETDRTTVLYYGTSVTALEDIVGRSKSK